MNINYKNIKLRAIGEEDLDLLLDMMNDAEIEKMIGGYSFPISIEQQRIWFENLNYSQNELRLIIEHEDSSGKGIGTICLNNIDWKNRNGEIHIKIKNENTYRRKGIGTTALKGLIKYSFEELNLNCLYSSVLECNTSSLRMHEKCGFKKEGLLRKRIYKLGKYHNIIPLSILKEDYEINDK